MSHEIHEVGHEPEPVSFNVVVKKIERIGSERTGSSPIQLDAPNCGGCGGCGGCRHCGGCGCGGCGGCGGCRHCGGCRS